MARETAIAIIDNPNLIDSARDFVERHYKVDPSKTTIYPMWVSLLQLDPTQLALRLIEDSDRGDWVRDTMPAFGGLSARQRANAIARARAAEAVYDCENP